MYGFKSCLPTVAKCTVWGTITMLLEAEIMPQRQKRNMISKEISPPLLHPIKAFLLSWGDTDTLRNSLQTRGEAERANSCR